MSGARDPVRFYYAVLLTGFVVIFVLLYFWQRSWIVAVFAVMGGLFEVASARTGLQAHRDQVPYPRLTYHLALIGFWCLVVSILAQQFLGKP